jgi:hypothetical protein
MSSKSGRELREAVRSRSLPDGWRGVRRRSDSMAAMVSMALGGNRAYTLGFVVPARRAIQEDGMPPRAVGSSRIGSFAMF